MRVSNTRSPTGTGVDVSLVKGDHRLAVQATPEEQVDRGVDVRPVVGPRHAGVDATGGDLARQPLEVGAQVGASGEMEGDQGTVVATIITEEVPEGERLALLGRMPYRDDG